MKYEKYDIFDKLYNTHATSNIDNLLLFYNKREGYFFCKYKTINKINESIILKYQESISKYQENLSTSDLNLDPNIDLFWSIELKVDNLLNDFNTIFEKTDIDPNSTLVLNF